MDGNYRQTWCDELIHRMDQLIKVLLLLSKNLGLSTMNNHLQLVESLWHGWNMYKYPMSLKVWLLLEIPKRCGHLTVSLSQWWILIQMMNCPQVSHLRQMSGDAVDSWGSFRQWNLLQPSTRFDRPHQKFGKQWQTLVHSWTNGPKVCKRRVQYNDKIFQSCLWRRVAPHYCILGRLGIPEPSAFGYKSSWMVFRSLLPWSCECAF